MLRGLQPLKLLESAAAAARGSRPRRLSIVDDDDDDDLNDPLEDEEEPLFLSPPENELDENPSSPSPTQKAATPQSLSVATKNRGATTKDPPTAASGTVHASQKDNNNNVDEQEEPRTSANDVSPQTATKATKNSNKLTPKTKKASNTAIATKNNNNAQLSHAITPCHKERATAAPTNTPTLTGGTTLPAVALTLGTSAAKKKPRLSVLEKTAASSLALAKTLVQYTEATFKAQQEAWKQAQKQKRLLQQQLEHAQQICDDLQARAEAALQDKRVASRDYKKLVKQWEKCQQVQEKKELEHKEALRKRLAGDVSVLEGKTAKKAKTLASKKPNKVPANEDDESSESEPEKLMNDNQGASDDDDSDWEGGAKTTKRSTSSCKPTTDPPTDNAPTSASKKRPSSSRCSQRAAHANTEEWTCTACTLLNRPELEECDMCGMPK